MTSRFDVLTQQLFQKDIADCSVEELQELANAHPYFAPAQYALLLKLKDTDYHSYEKQYQKVILFYHDPLAFDRFINEDQYEVNASSFAETETSVSDEKEIEIFELSPLETSNINQEKQEKAEEDFESIVPEVYQRLEEKEEVFAGNTEQTEGQSIINTLPAETSIEQEEKKIITESRPEINREFNQEESITSPMVEPTETSISINKIAESRIEKEVIPTDNALVFEPYHTVDYFASQGIKLSQEEATKDKFGKQLKSFTEWLKTMRKLPAPEQVKPLDTVAEQKVETLAAHSVEGEEVYTETMAEVWMRQGNKEKAIEIYNKLSLQNPSKRAYFAAKINSL